MGLIYYYNDCSTSHYALKRVDGTCDKDPDRTVLIGVFCKTCPHYCGIKNNFVICEFHEKDDEGASETRSEVYENLQHEALCALDGY